MTPAVFFIQSYVCRLDRQPSAVGHGVLGVDGQVHEHLFDLVRIGIYPTQPRGQAKFDLDHLRDGALKELRDVKHLPVEIDRFEPALHLAAEGKKLPGEFRSSSGGMEDLPEFPTAFLFGGLVQQKQFGIAQNPLKKVVEVVGHPTGKSPDGLHLLGMHERGLHLPPGRNIPQKIERRRPSLPLDEHGIDIHPSNLAGLGQDLNS